MTNINIKLDGNKLVCSVKGHAGFNIGNDIVCSAISALSTALAIGIQNIKSCTIDKMILESGNVELEAYAEDDIASLHMGFLFDTFYQSFCSLEAGYEKYVYVEGER